jgi:hypothetical protein
MNSFNCGERRKGRDWYVVSTIQDPELKVVITGYEPEGRGFYTRSYHWKFSLT